MKLLIVFIIAFTIYAQDESPVNSADKVTVEQLKAQVATQKQQIIELQENLALQSKITQAFHDQADSCNIQMTVLNVKQAIKDNK